MRDAQQVPDAGALEQQIAALTARVAEQEQKIENLRVALVTARRVGAAIGVIMATRRCTDEAAFDVLRVASQQSNRKVRDIADEILFTGALPDKCERRSKRQKPSPQNISGDVNRGDAEGCGADADRVVGG